MTSPTPSEIRHRLEELSDRAMPGRRRASIGEWIMRLDRGATGRANSLWPTGDPGVEVAEAIDQVEDWYRSAGLPPRVMVFDRCDPAVVAELNRRGYGHAPGAHCLVADIATVRARHPIGDLAPGWRIEVASEPTTATAALTTDDDRRAENATTSLDQHYVEVFDHDRLLGGGVATVDGDWVGLFGLVTLPEARRRGVASVVLDRRLSEGAKAGATQAWLQVMADNHPARTLFESLGFALAHSYDYRLLPL